MSELEVVRLNGGKAFPKDSDPPALAHQYLNQDESAQDLTTGTWTGQFRVEQIHLPTGESQPVGQGAGAVAIDVPTATGTYNWADADFATVGVFRGIMWIGNAVERYGSVIFEWEVADAPGATPTV